MDLDLAAMASCTRCALSLTRQRVVCGSGPLRPALMIVGEAPGRLEDETGEPFIGRSGQLLFRLIEEEVGLVRAQCYTTSVVKCRPPNNRPPQRLELESCRPWITQQLAAVAPRVVVVLGATAARSLLGRRDPMGTLHGEVVALGDARALATYHPAAALRGGARVENLLRADLRSVRQLIADAGPAYNAAHDAAHDVGLGPSSDSSRA